MTIAIAATVTWLTVEAVASGLGLIYAARALSGKDFHAPREFLRS